MQGSGESIIQNRDETPSPAVNKIWWMDYAKKPGLRKRHTASQCAYIADWKKGEGIIIKLSYKDPIKIQRYFLNM